MDWTRLAERFEHAAEALGNDAAAALTSELERECSSTDNAAPTEASLRIATALQGARLFPLLVDAGDALLRTGQDAPELHRRYAQGLIELGELQEGLRTIDDTLSRGNDVTNEEQSELVGLRARALKQHFVRGGHRPNAFLEKAVATCEGGWRSTKSRWHGINSVALRKNFDVRSPPPADMEPQELANTILQQIEAEDSAGQLDRWDPPTAAEACIALDRWDDALSWARRYVDEYKHDAFAIGSTSRQMREIWRLKLDIPEHRAMLDLLDTGAVKAPRGHWSPAILGADRIAKLDESASYLEAAFGQEEARSIRWILEGLAWACGVARVQPYGVAASDRAEGTGFLIPGNTLYAGWTDALVLVTNFHVANAHGVRVLPNTLTATQAQASFDGVPGLRAASGPFKVSGVLWESPNSPLSMRPPQSVDIAVLQLQDAPEWTPPLMPTLPGPTITSPSRVYVIGHPAARDLHLALEDNDLQDTDGTLMHYRSHTLGGNSGSPLFDERWRLIGVHHAGAAIRIDADGNEIPGTGLMSISGDGRLSANEGFSLAAIQRAIADNPAPPS